MGIRTNNPGNIVKSEINWVGEVPCDHEPLNECFSDPYFGIRAMAIILRTYMHKHGLVTIEDIMARYSEFERAARGVSAISGIPVDAELGTWDKDVMVRLIHAIIVQENGYNPYHLDFIGEVLNDTYGADHFLGEHASWRGTQDVGSEATSRSRQALTDDGRTDGSAWTIYRDTEQYPAAVHMDPALYSCLCRAVHRRAAEGGSRAYARSAGDDRVDGVGTRLLALHVGAEPSGVARGPRTDDHAARYPSSEQHCRSILWRIADRAPWVRRRLGCGTEYQI